MLQLKYSSLLVLLAARNVIVFLCFARTIVEEYNESCSDDDDRLTQRYETKAPNERLSFVISNDRYHEQYLVNKQEIINKFADPFIRIQLCVVCPCIVISISTYTVSVHFCKCT